MIRRWLALTYYLYALRLAALSHFYFNRLYVTYAGRSKGSLKAQKQLSGCLRRVGVQCFGETQTLIICAFRDAVALNRRQ